MLTRNIIVSATLAALACIGLTGCEGAAPQPSEDAVYYFLANARLHGKMRVCWKEGQEYAVSVTKADAALQGELNKINALLGYEETWEQDDPRWADKAAVQKHADELTKLADEGSKARAKCLADLRAALDKLPGGLTWKDDNAKAAFKQRLWTALAVEGRPLEDEIKQLEDLLAARLRLFEKAAECAAASGKTAEKSDDDKAGDKDECRVQVDELLAAYQGQVEAENARFLDWAKARIAEIAPVLKKIDKQKDREQYTLLDNEKTYIRAILESSPKKLRELIKKAHQEQIKNEQTSQPDQQKAEYLKKRIAALESDLAESIKRADEILKQ